jgi:hypothetical protein
MSARSGFAFACQHFSLVLTPTYPGFEGGVEALRNDPSPIEALTFPAIIEHIGGIIDELERPPIIMGHVV